MDFAESLNRTMKLAMDEGKVASYADAERLFQTFRLRIAVGSGFSHAPAAQAAVLTILSAARKSFLGGVEVIGALDERCTMAWFKGRTLRDLASAFCIELSSGTAQKDAPTIVVGATQSSGDFCLGLGLEADGFTLLPGGASGWDPNASVAVGVAAAGAALNEAFQHVYRGWPLAGQRRIQFDFMVGDKKHNPHDTWVIGLGHLGQAYLWTRALAADSRCGIRVRLTDFDEVTLSSLSTCLLVDLTDIGRKKVDAVGDKLEQIGFEVVRDASKITLEDQFVDSNEELVVVAVDNIGLRRGLDRLRAARLIECGIGDGTEGFTRVQVHAFPGSRLARDVWAGDDARASRVVNITTPAYQALLRETADECGTTLVASRSVATPFVGAFAGAVLAHLGESVTTGDAWNFDVNCL